MLAVFFCIWEEERQGVPCPPSSPAKFLPFVASLRRYFSTSSQHCLIFPPTPAIPPDATSAASVYPESRRAAFAAFDVRSPLTPLQSAVPKNTLITRSESALPMLGGGRSKLSTNINHAQDWRVREYDSEKDKTRTLETAGCGNPQLRIEGHPRMKKLRVEKGGIRGRERKANPTPRSPKGRRPGSG
jgi:hypothetical protein